MSIFNTNKIKNSDSKRDTKIELLNEIKEYLQGIDREVKLEILEKHLWRIIREYKLAQQKEDSVLRELSSEYPDFENDWHEKLISTNRIVKAKQIRTVVKKAIITYGASLTKELKRMRAESTECWKIDEKIDRNGIGNSQYLWSENLIKFKEKFPPNVNEIRYEYQAAREILIEELQEKIEKGGRKENGKYRSHILKKLFNDISDVLRTTKIFYDEGKLCVDYDEEKCILDVNCNSIESFQKDIKKYINNLDDNYLPIGNQKADLLRELDRVIENGKANFNSTANTKDNNDKVNEVDNSTDDYVEPIFDECYEEEITVLKNEDPVNNSPDNKKNDNKEESKTTNTNDSGFINHARKIRIQRITKYLNQEPVLADSDLEPKNRNWLEQLKAANNWDEIVDIATTVESDIKNQRKIKQQSSELDKIIESPSVDTKNLQVINNSLGEEANEVRAQRAKKAMIEKDPEAYFDGFIKWIEEEDKKLEEESKKVEKAVSISELEFNEEERQFLAGKITGQQERERIAQQIEVKINVKKKTWSLWKWIKAQTQWLKTKAQLLRKNNKVGFDQKVGQIKQEIKNTENSSNKYTREAYKNSQNQAQALLRELENVANRNTNPTTDNNKFPIGWVVVGSGAVLLTAILITGLIVRRRRKMSKIKK